MSAKYKINLINGTLNYYLGAKNLTSTLRIYTTFKANNDTLSLYGFLNPYQQVYNVGIGLSSPLLIRKQTHQYNIAASSSAILNNYVSYTYTCDGTVQGGDNIDNSQQYYFESGSSPITEAQKWINNGDNYVRPTGMNSKAIICADNSGSPMAVKFANPQYGYPNDGWVFNNSENLAKNYLSLWLTYNRSDDGYVTEYPFYNKPYLDYIDSDFENNVPYDAFVCSESVGLLWGNGLSNNTDIFSDIYVVKTKDNSQLNMSGYLKISKTGVGTMSSAVILSYNDNLVVPNNVQIVAHFKPNQITIPDNAQGHSYGIEPKGVPFNSSSNGGYYMDNSTNDLLNKKLLPYTDYLIPTQLQQQVSKLKTYNGNTLKALPVFMFFKTGDTKPFLIYQPYSAAAMEYNSSSIVQNGTIYSDKASGHTQVVPFESITDNYSFDWNSKLLTETKTLVPNLIATHGDWTVIDKVMTSNSQVVTDPDQTNGGWISRYTGNSAKLALYPSGCYPYYIWAGSNTYMSKLTSVQEATANVQLVKNGNSVTTSIIPEQSSPTTFGQINTYRIPQGSEYTGDLFGSLALVNNQPTLSNCARLCVYRSDKDVMVSNNKFKPITPPGVLDFVTGFTQPFTNHSWPNGLTPGKLTNAMPYIESLKLVYPKVIAPDYTWWPSACNFQLFSYDENGNKTLTADCNWDGTTITSNMTDEPNNGGGLIPNPPSIDNPTNDASASSVLYVKV